MADGTETTPENFEDAFSRLSDLIDEEGELKKDEPAPEAAAAPAEPAPEAAAAPAETGGTPAETPPPPAEEPKAASEEPKAPPEEDTDAILQRLARLVKENPPAEAEPPPQQPQNQPEPALYTNEETELLTNYEKEWPDVAKAEALRRRAEYRELVGFVFNEVAKELRPVVEMVQTMTQRTHLSDLKATVNDYDDVRDKVIDWVQQQPTYLQVAYKHVIEQGTVDEVADLVNRYKRETGVTAPQAAAAPAARKTETELPTATKQAAAALAPVSSKRSAGLQSADPEDFESAFAAFASKM